MLQEAPLVNASPLILDEAPPRRRRCPPKYSCCCVVLTVLAALLLGAAAGGGLVATVLMQLAATPASPDLPPASSCCAPAAGGLTGRFIGNVSATKTVLGPSRTCAKRPPPRHCATARRHVRPRDRPRLRPDSPQAAARRAGAREVELADQYAPFVSHPGTRCTSTSR